MLGMKFARAPACINADGRSSTSYCAAEERGAQDGLDGFDASAFEAPDVDPYLLPCFSSFISQQRRVLEAEGDNRYQLDAAVGKMIIRLRPRPKID